MHPAVSHRLSTVLARRRSERTCAGFALGAALLLGALCAPDAAAQSLPRRINCGDLNGYASGEAGWELFTETAAPSGMGMAPAPLDTVHVAGHFPNAFGTLPTRSDVASIDSDQLWRTHRFTSLKLADFTVLSMNGLAANTPYRVKLELGALFPWVDPAGPIDFEFKLTRSRQVRVETQNHAAGPGIVWRTYASGLRCETSGHAATYETFVSSIVDLWVLAKTDASGVLRLRLSTDGSDPLFLSGYELHAHEALPLSYKRSGGAALQASGAGATSIAAAFNAGDFAGAEALALASNNSWVRGVALLHLIGWLDGSRDGYLHRLPEARAALQAAQGNHPGAAWLLDELDSFERALDHRFDPGLPSKFDCPEAGGLGFLNPDCADQAATGDGQSTANLNPMIAVRELRGITAARSGPTQLQALVERNNGSLPLDAWEPSPLAFTALKLVGTTLFSINPLLSLNTGDPDAVAMDQDKQALLKGFRDLGFAAADFPEDLELLLFAAIMDKDKNPSQWTPTELATLFTPAQIAASWWGPVTAAQTPPMGAPAWATQQRDHGRILRSIATYWLQERMDVHELGGGWGDDIELMGLLSTVLAPKQLQTDRRLVDALEGMARYGWVDRGDIVDGYHGDQGLTDVEHSAEYTTYPYLVMRNLYGHTRRSAEIAMASSRHILSAGAPSQAWAGLNNQGRVHFKSENFSSSGPSLAPGVTHDALLNGKASFPGLSLAQLKVVPAGSPLVTDLRAWANGWRDDALSTVGAKPAGWMGEVQWPSGVMGNSGFWWSNTGSSADVWNLSSGVMTYPLELLRTAYLRSSASDRWRYLVPAVRIFRDTLNWENAGQPAGALGSAHWAASKFRNNIHFGPLVLAYLSDLEQDANLGSITDPYGSGHPYVDAALITRLRDWVDLQFNGQTTALWYALGDVEPCALHTGKNSMPVVNAYTNDLTYYRLAYPLLTKHVVHTDRVLLNYQSNGTLLSAAAHSGANVTQGLGYRPLLRWERRGTTGSDVSVLMNLRAFDDSSASAFVHNFGDQPEPLRVLLEQGLPAGRYEIEWGAASGNCDTFPAGGVTELASRNHGGAGSAQDITLVPGLNLVSVRRSGPTTVTPAAYELALDPPRIAVRSGPGVLDLLFQARATNLGSVASPPATLKLYVSVVSQTGAVQEVGPDNELLLANLALPAIPPANGYDLSLADLELSVPVNDLIIAVLVNYGQGIQVRAEVLTGALEEDLLNNDITRAWFLGDIEFE